MSEKEIPISAISIGSDYGERYWFKKPSFEYDDLYVKDDGYVHGKVYNNIQKVWKGKKWNKETGKVVDGGDATYFDLVPVDVSDIDAGNISESPKTCDGIWNGYYIKASKEAYDLFVFDMELCLNTKDIKSESSGYYFIENHKVYHTTSISESRVKQLHKPIYIVDGKLSATQYHPDEVAFTITKHPDIKQKVLDATSFENSVYDVLNPIYSMLIEKNDKYGNSALEPKRIFSKMNSIEQLYVRIDDKLSRISNQNLNDDEDVIDDLIGYLVLLKIAINKE
jgi:hypothetical protein